MISVDAGSRLRTRIRLIPISRSILPSSQRKQGRESMCLSSFPRKRESICCRSALCYHRTPRSITWIPAFAGMTSCKVPAPAFARVTFFRRDDELPDTSRAVLYHPSPQVHCSVAAPRAPRLGQLIRAAGRDSAKILAEYDVFPGEGIGPAQRPHCDIVRGPASDTGKRDELLHRGVRVCAGVEIEAAGRNLGRKSDDSARPALNYAKRRDVVDA